MTAEEMDDMVMILLWSDILKFKQAYNVFTQMYGVAKVETHQNVIKTQNHSTKIFINSLNMINRASCFAHTHTLLKTNLLAFEKKEENVNRTI